MGKFLTIFATATIFSGCCTVPAHVPFECPERPEFVTYTDALWEEIPKLAQLSITADDIEMKEYILACEERAKIHND